MSITLFVDGIALGVTAADLDEVFAPFHPTRTILARHRGSGVPLGFAFVVFDDEARATDALTQLNGRSLAGRRMAISRSICPAAFEAQS